MVSQMETEVASEDITMVSFRGPWGVCGWDAGKAGPTSRGVAGEGPGIRWARGGKGLRKTTGRLEKLGSRLLEPFGFVLARGMRVLGPAFDPPGQQIAPGPTGL
jgi:hypothetical protein